MGFDFFDFNLGASPEEDEEEQRRRRAMQLVPPPVPEDEDEDPTQQAESILTEDSENIDPDDMEVKPVDSARALGPVSPMQKFDEWASRMPKREDYQTGTKDKIQAGLLGFLGGMTGKTDQGIALGREVLNRPHAEAMAEWKNQGSALKDVATLGGTYQGHGVRARGDELRFETDKGKIAATMAGIAQRETAAKAKLEVDMKNATTGAERAAAQARHDQAMEGIQRERNSIQRISAGAQQTQAAAAGASAAAAGVSAAARAREVDANIAKPPTAKEPSYSDTSNATDDALLEMLAVRPEIEKKYFKRDPNNPRNIYPIPGLEIDPKDRQEFEQFMADVKLEGERRARRVDPLGGANPGLNRHVQPPVRARVP